MPVIFVQHYRRADAKAKPGALFVFGDNMVRRGFGGQAGEMRGEPNAVGIPTKWKPSNEDGAFFTEHDFLAAKGPIDMAFDRIEAHLKSGGEVVWPKDGIGTGLARLPERAPEIYRYIEDRLDALLAICQ